MATIFSVRRAAILSPMRCEVAREVHMFTCPLLHKFISFLLVLIMDGYLSLFKEEVFSANFERKLEHLRKRNAWNHFSFETSTRSLFKNKTFSKVEIDVLFSKLFPRGLLVVNSVIFLIRCNSVDFNFLHG